MNKYGNWGLGKNSLMLYPYITLLLTLQNA